MARPNLWLRENDGTNRIIGLWGGAGVVPPPAGQWTHWITVAADRIAGHGLPLTGCISVYESDDTFAAVADPRLKLPEHGSDGLALMGEERLSLPPLEALEVYGSTTAKHWLGSSNRQSDAGVADAYDREYQKHCPLYHDDIVAVLGGWHATWPELDAYDEQNGRLLLWTFRDAEPWVEVWLSDSGELTAIPRIT